MTCINKNTVFYKTLVNNNYDSKEIAKIDLTLESEKFNQWYGIGERDSFKNPVIIKEVYLQNDKGEQITLNDLLNSKEYEKRKFYKADLTYLDKVNTLLKELKIGIATRISNFRGTDYAKNLEGLLDNLNKLQDIDYIQALNTHTEYILKTVSQIETRFVDFDRINKSKLDKKQLYENEQNFKNFLLQSSSFLETFSKIDQLESPKVEGLEIGKTIKLLKETENRVTDLKNRITSEVESHSRNNLERLIKNPEIRRGVIDFLAAQSDESGIQRWMDALGDSHVPFLAAVDKYYKLHMYEKEDEAKEMQKEWRDFVKSFNGDFDNFLNRILELKENKKTGRFIQEYDEEYYNQLFDYRDKLSSLESSKGKSSQEYKDILDEYFKWRRENTEQKYIDSYYKALDNLVPEAREVKEEIDSKKKVIISKGIDKLTEEDWNQLKELESEMKWLKSSINKDGSHKVGESLKIANSLFKYSQSLGKFYYTVGINQKGFNKARKIAEEKGIDELEKWDLNNTSEQYSDRFWELFNNIVSQLPNDERIEAIRNEIKQITIPYKNEKGEVRVEDLPEEIRKEIDYLNQEKAKLKSSGKTAEHAEIGRKFRDLVKFVPTSEYLKVLKEKQESRDSGKITKEEFNTWFDKNHEEHGEEIKPVSIWTTMIPRNLKFIERKPNNLWKLTDIKPEFINPNYKEDSNGFAVPKDKWLNTKFNSLNQNDKDNLAKINKTLSYLVEHSKNNIIKQGYIPAIPKDNRTILDTLKGEKIAKEEKDAMRAITETDEIVKFLPFKYIRRLNTVDFNEERFKIKEGMTEEQILEIQKLKRDTIKANKISHGESLDYNLKDTMENFIDAALTNKYKSRIESDIKLFKEQLKHMKIKQLDSKGKPLYNKIKSQLAGEKIEHEVNAIGSNTEKHFNDWLDAVFYEDFELDEGKLSDWTSKIQNFTSLRAMGFNVLSGLNNKIMGNINERIEAAGGRYYNYTDYRNARKLYFSNITNFISDRNKKESSNLMTAFIKEMDVLISQDELNNRPGGLLATAQHKLRMIKDAAYFMQHIGEHQVQNSTLIAMANSHRIINGEIMSFNEFFEKRKFNIDQIYKDQSLEAALLAIDSNSELKRTLSQEFDNFSKVIDVFELKDGYAKLKEDSGISKEQIFEFKQRVIGVNQKLHGIYNIEDAGMIQRNALGRLAIQFRKWMRPGWNKRFGSKFGKKIYNERVRDYEEGMYITTAKYLGSPFIKSYQEYRKSQQSIALSAYKALVDGFKDLIFNSKIRWHSMDEVEKANVRRTAAEFLFLVSVTAIGFLAKNMRGEDDDDDKVKDKTLIFTLYQADRLFGELTNYTPIGVVREGNRLFSSPSPVFNSLEDVGKLATALFLYPFRSEEDRVFKSGTYHGKGRISTYFQDLIPFYNQLKRLDNLNTNTQRYGIFR